MFYITILNAPVWKKLSYCVLNHYSQRASVKDVMLLCSISLFSTRLCERRYVTGFYITTLNAPVWKTLCYCVLYHYSQRACVKEVKVFCSISLFSTRQCERRYVTVFYITILNALVWKTLWYCVLYHYSQRASVKDVMLLCSISLLSTPQCKRRYVTVFYITTLNAPVWKTLCYCVLYHYSQRASVKDVMLLCTNTTFSRSIIKRLNKFRYLTIIYNIN